ncbi:MAG: hypothetical protein J5494_07695 [Candidatus Methanomethylophilaceae archaeon]|nr:hypothetical protein [Candidatus Methanomethylophilaceae archaeon]
MENKSGKKRNSVCRVLLILFASVRRLLLILLILALAAAFCFHQIHPHYFPLGIKTHNAGLYEDGSYSTLAGGQAAAKFFPEKDELGEYSSIDFYFVNNVLRFTLFGRIGNTFRLDVRYSEEAAYDEAVRQLFRNYHCGDYYRAHKLNLMWWDAYYVVEFVPGSIDDRNYFYLCLNEKERIVRFLFMEDANINYPYRRVSDCDDQVWIVWGKSRDESETVKNKYDSYIIEGFQTENAG